MAVTESVGIAESVVPLSILTFSVGNSISVPVVVLNTFTTAFCGSATYVISVFVPGSVGIAGGMYPCVGSFGTFGCNGVSPIFGVYPGTYGITGTFGSVGFPGLVGSVGLFGYGFGSKFVPSGGVTPVGGVNTHEPSLVYTTFTS